MLNHFFIFELMNRLKLIYVLTFFFICSVCTSQYTSIINSNRPGLTQGAYAIAPGVYQLEFGSSYRQDSFVSIAQAKSKGAGFTLDLRTGLILQNLEIIYRVDYHNDILSFNNEGGKINIYRKGTKRNTLGFKLLVFDPFRNTDWYKPNPKSYKANKGLRFIDLIPAVSFYLGSELSFGNIYPYGEPFSPIFSFNSNGIKQDEISGEFMIITQNHFLKNYVLVNNIGKRYLGSDYEQSFLSTSLMIPIKKRLMSFVEQVAVHNRINSDITLTAGAVYLINENIQVDAFVSHTLKDTPAIFSTGIGISYRIDRYSDSGIPYEIKELRRQRKKKRLDRKINQKKIKEIKDREKQKRKNERKRKKK